MSLCCGLENNSQKALNPRHFLKKHRAAVGLAYSFFIATRGKTAAKKPFSRALHFFRSASAFCGKAGGVGFRLAEIRARCGSALFPAVCTAAEFVRPRSG